MCPDPITSSRQLELLRLIRDAGTPLTKKDLARLSETSLALIGKVTADLEDAGLVVDTGVADSSGGRKPQLLGINPDLGYTIGLDIGGANIRGIAADLSGRLLASVRFPLASRQLSGHPLDQITNYIRQIMRAGQLDSSRLLGVGIDISGVIDFERGICRFCPNINGLNNVPVVRELEQRLGVPAVIDDSLRSGAIAEHQFGIARNLTDFLWVGIGIGIGAALMLQGRLHRGVGGTAGELGHITVREGGERCNCGNRGCLEVMASGPAIVRRARQSIADGIQSTLRDLVDRGEDLTVEAIARAAQDGDKMAYYIIDRTGDYLGIAIATALNLLGVQDVIIAGGVALTGPILLDAIDRSTRMRALPALSPRISVRPSGLDDLASARGVAWQAADRLFAPESLKQRRSLVDIAVRSAGHSPRAVFQLLD